ncbi:MAG: hypothetical protein Ct9H300mP1_16600 [Planctomycetaceae bacterium]|nr:MAG: hypothetical protein Ct9H300mP1_16600 [Planctomycetaceae bacterium]
MGVWKNMSEIRASGDVGRGRPQELAEWRTGFGNRVVDSGTQAAFTNRVEKTFEFLEVAGAESSRILVICRRSPCPQSC